MTRENKALMLVRVNIGIEESKTLQVSQDFADTLINIVALYGRKWLHLMHEYLS